MAPNLARGLGYLRFAFACAADRCPSWQARVRTGCIACICVWVCVGVGVCVCMCVCACVFVWVDALVHALRVVLSLAADTAIAPHRFASSRALGGDPAL